MTRNEKISVGMFTGGVILALRSEQKNIAESNPKYSIKWVDSGFTTKEIIDLCNEPFTVEPAPLQFGNSYISLAGGDVAAWDTTLYGGYNYCLDLMYDGPVEDYYYCPVEALRKFQQEMDEKFFQAYGTTVAGLLGSGVMLGKKAAEQAAANYVSKMGIEVAQKVTPALGFLQGFAVGYQLYGVLEGFGVKESDAVTAASCVGLVIGTIACFPPVGTIVALVCSIVLTFIGLGQTIKRQKAAIESKKRMRENAQMWNNIMLSHCSQITLMKHLCEKRGTIYGGELNDLLLQKFNEYMRIERIKGKDKSKGHLMEALTRAASGPTDRADKWGLIDNHKMTDFTETYQVYNRLIKDIGKVKEDYGIESFDAGLHSEAVQQLENFFDSDVFKTTIATKEYLEDSGINFKGDSAGSKAFYKVMAERYALLLVPCTVGGRRVQERASKYFQVVLPFNDENKTYKVTPVMDQFLPSFLEITTAVTTVWENQPVRVINGRYWKSWLTEANKKISSDEEYRKYINTPEYKRLETSAELTDAGFVGTCLLREKPKVIVPTIGSNSLTVPKPFDVVSAYKFSTLSAYGAIFEGTGGVNPIKVPLVVRSDKPVVVEVEPFDPSVPVLPGISVDTGLLEKLESFEEKYSSIPIVAAYMFIKGRTDDLQEIMQLLTQGFTFEFNEDNLSKFPGVSLLCEESTFDEEVGMEMTIEAAGVSSATYHSVNESKIRLPVGKLGKCYVLKQYTEEQDISNLAKINDALKGRTINVKITKKDKRFLTPVLVPTDDGISVGEETSPYTVLSGGIDYNFALAPDTRGFRVNFFDCEVYSDDVFVPKQMLGVGLYFEGFIEKEVNFNDGSSASKILLPAGYIGVPLDDTLSAYTALMPMIRVKEFLICC